LCWNGEGEKSPFINERRLKKGGNFEKSENKA
jgi:hypothetical protein